MCRVRLQSAAYDVGMWLAEPPSPTVPNAANSCSLQADEAPRV
jgi:hypothetical protein